MTCFVGDDLPFLGTLSADDHIGSCYGLLAAIGLTISSDTPVGGDGCTHACLTQPGEADSRFCVAGAKQCPVAVMIRLGAAPRGKVIQTVLDIDIV